MTYRDSRGALTELEKRAVKTLLKQGWRNQDIQYEINIGRVATINSARITEVDNDDSISPLSDAELEEFLHEKRLYNPLNDLHPKRDETLWRAHQAMLTAIAHFNNPYSVNRGELFATEAVRAWTLLLLALFKKRGWPHQYKKDKNLRYFELGKLAKIAMEKKVISNDIMKNLEIISDIRDAAMHHPSVSFPDEFFQIFQANVINFDNKIAEWFGKRRRLYSHLAISLQVSPPQLPHIKGLLSAAQLPEGIAILKQKISEEMEELGQEYALRIAVTYVKGSPSQSYQIFVNPDSKSGAEIAAIVDRHVPGDELYPYHPKEVVKLVKEALHKHGRGDLANRFKRHRHTQAWKKYKVRPNGKSEEPNKTNRTYCIYHRAHNDYTYNDKWVEFLVEQIIIGKLSI